MEDTKLMAHVHHHKVPLLYLDQYERVRAEVNKTLPKGHKHRPARGLSLKVLAPFFLGVPPFWETPGNYDNEEYNRKDCVYTHQLHQYFSDHMTADEKVFYRTRMLPWSEMLLKMILKGIAIDPDELERLEAAYALRVEELEDKLDLAWTVAHEAYGTGEARKIRERYEGMFNAYLTKRKHPLNVDKIKKRYEIMCARALAKLSPESTRINYGSSKQMLWLLRDYLGLDVSKVDLTDDDENPDSTGKAVLHRLAASGREDVATYLEWRAAKKILTAFLPSYRKMAVDSVLHPTFNLTGTRTGRISSSKPNLQQVPPKLYSIFKPREGHKFVQYDLGSIEAALIALYSNDETLYDLLKQGVSIHDYNTKVLFGLSEPVDEIKELYPKQRQTVKNIGFACFYGAGARRLEAVFKTAGFMVDTREARRMLDTLKGTYPRAFSFHKEVTKLFEDGGTVMNLLGRPVSIQDKSEAYMKGFNSLIQSSASDLNLHACHRWARMSPEHHPLLVIHDCVLGEVREALADDAAKKLVDCMTDYDLDCENGPIKLSAEGGVSSLWVK